MKVVMSKALKPAKFRVNKISIYLKLCLWLIVLLSFVSTASAQYAGFKPVGNHEAFASQFSAESAKLMSISNKFIQEKTLTALTETITSGGEFWFKRSNRVRIEYQKPFEYLIIMSGDRMLVRDNQKDNQINVASNKLFRQVNRVILDCVQGTILTSPDFVSSVFENDKMYLLELTPKVRGLSDFFKSIILKVEKKNYSVFSIELIEPMGDSTLIIFTDKKINAQVPDAIFAF